jgi:hypothetical protein
MHLLEAHHSLLHLLHTDVEKIFSGSPYIDDQAFDQPGISEKYVTYWNFLLRRCLAMQQALRQQRLSCWT